MKGVTCLKRAPWNVIVPSVLNKLWEVENYLFYFVRVFNMVWVVWVFCWEFWLLWDLWVFFTFWLVWEVLWVLWVLWVWVLWVLWAFWVLALGLTFEVVVVVVTLVAGWRLRPLDDEEEDELWVEEEEDEDWELFWVVDALATFLSAILLASARVSFPLYSKE